MGLEAAPSRSCLEMLARCCSTERTSSSAKHPVPRALAQREELAVGDDDRLAGHLDTFDRRG